MTSNIYTTYEQVGRKEDVSNTISNIDPTKTPFLTSIKTEKVKNTLYQWQEDHLDPVGTNAQSEGFTATAEALTPTVMRNNGTQILSKVVQVAETANAVDAYGRAKEIAYQVAKASAAIKRDLENSLVGTRQTLVSGTDSPNGAGTPRQFAGYQAMIDAGNILTVASAALTEADLLSVNQTLYEVGGEGSTFMVKPADALRVAQFAYRSTIPAGSASSVAQSQVQVKNGDTKLVVAVDFYKSPFGTQKVVINRFQNTLDALVYDPEMWRLAVLRPWTRQTLAKTGDNVTMMIVGEYGLKHRNYKGSALITGLAP